MKSLFISLNKIKINLKSILKFELVYRFLTFLVFYPIFVACERLLLIVNGSTTITAFNVQSTLLNPLTWLVFLLMAVLLCAFSLIEMFALYNAVHASYSNRKITWREMFSTGVCATGKYIRPRNFLLLFYVLLILPIVGAFDASNVTKFFAIPGFIMESVGKYWYYGVAYNILMILFICLYIRWFFAIYILSLSEEPNFTAACKKSALLTKGIKNKLKMLLYMAGSFFVLFVSIAVIVGVLLLVLLLLCVWLNFGDMEFLKGINSDFFDLSLTILGFSVTWITMPFMAASVVGLYHSKIMENGEEFPKYIKKGIPAEKKHFVKTVLIVFCAVIVFFSGPLRLKQIKWMLNTSNGLPMIMAHRGFSSAAPENTAEAMQAAIDIGVKSVEFDVQMTKDGEIILLHDDSLERTTGYKKRIWDATYEEIKDLDASVGFRKETGNDYPKTRIPTLDEVLKVAKGKLFCNIEIKRTGHDDGIEAKVVEIIRKNDFLDNCDVTSQDYSTIEAVKAAGPEVLTAYTTVIGIGATEELKAADIISMQESFVNFREIQGLRAAGKRIFVWTVNDAAVVEELIGLNVDAILTNDPAMGQNVLKSHATGLGDIANRLDDILSEF